MEELEAMIRAAGNYVVPSSDMRPRTIEKAKEEGRLRQDIRRVSWLAVSGFALWGMCLAIISSADTYRDRWTSPDGEQLQRIVARQASISHESIEWGLVSAFAKMRGMRFDNLGAAALDQVVDR